ncbi:hypothetical protein CCHOA_00925 [Corynebacterium choanae]|uniref:Uncharacterized protein n=1 Tax=Corynebacterium choanae TaxID=1862358 RepID=A0A3G6J9A9_9CORY|nr:hypothetical protein CCHOA_00925 [Corynebacterium choanae]
MCTLRKAVRNHHGQNIQQPREDVSHIGVKRAVAVAGAPISQPLGFAKGVNSLHHRQPGLPSQPSGLADP